MEDLVKKYPAIIMPYGYIDFIRREQCLVK
jgi:hypothetical protein